ncbi:MAG: DUF126 domain-containing protein [Candidatus Micrarchaeaceae archaeon]
MTLKRIVEGNFDSEALVSLTPISFFGDIDPNTGVVKDQNSNIFGKSVKGKLLILPGTRGSTVGSYVLYALAKNGVAPSGIIVKTAEPILIVGCILGNIPLASGLTDNYIDEKISGKSVFLDSETAELVVR